MLLPVDEMAEFYVHIVTLEKFEGAGAYGDIYAAPRLVACLREGKRRLVRSTTGEETVSETTLYMSVEDGAGFTPGSRITYNGHETHVITNGENDAPGLDLPDHAMVTLQ